MGDRRQDKNKSDDDKIASLVDGVRHGPGRSPSTPASASSATGEGGSSSASTSAGRPVTPDTDTDREVDGGSTYDEFDPDSLLYDLSSLHHCQQINIRQMLEHNEREEDLMKKYQERMKKQQRFLAKINKNNEEKYKLLKKSMDRQLVRQPAMLPNADELEWLYAQSGGEEPQHEPQPGSEPEGKGESSGKGKGKGKGKGRARPPPPPGQGTSQPPPSSSSTSG